MERILTYSLGNSPRAKEQSNDVLPQAPGKRVVSVVLHAWRQSRVCCVRVRLDEVRALASDGGGGGWVVHGVGREGRDETGKRRTITDNDQLSSNLWVRESG